MITDSVNLVLKHNGDVFAAYASIRQGLKEALRKRDGSEEYLIDLEKNFKDVIVDAAMKEHGYTKGTYGAWVKKE